ncbi:hypothetical protein SMD44_00696 [Streptomyces alboflavus]|uniref:Uncharacterized protein n=1 Tax=Streptomyces alboflavus TaxID=67267 RepID=A0A1Z1W4E6_9ACTN|nr:hypothetical protein SMD44_00696 [Streptomyces alboflavus]
MSRMSAPMRSAPRRSASVRSAATSRAPRRLAPRRFAPRKRLPMRLAPRWSFLRPGTADLASSLARSSSGFTSPRSASTFTPSRVSGVSRVSASIREYARRRSRCTGRAAARSRACAVYFRSSWRCRTTGKTSYIVRAVSGASRQPTPLNVTCETFWPAPKQSKTVQPW